MKKSALGLGGLSLILLQSTGQNQASAARTFLTQHSSQETVLDLLANQLSQTEEDPEAEEPVEVDTEEAIEVEPVEDDLETPEEPMITPTPAVFSQNTFKLAPVNVGKFQEIQKELIERGLNEDVATKICAGELDKLRSLPRSELEFIRDNAENLVLVYEDQMNFRNDIAKGGKVTVELLKITGQVGIAEKLTKLNHLLVD
jgi:hypothetical protein